jgi:hypothetical protein
LVTDRLAAGAQDWRRGAAGLPKQVSPNSRLIEAPWLVNGGHGASFRLPFGSQVIVSALRAAQLYSNSIIVYSSDNVKKSACPPGCRGSI